jgi:hypothetical protein
MVKQAYSLIFDYLKLDYFDNLGIVKTSSKVYKYYKRRQERENFIFGENCQTLKFNNVISKCGSEKSSYDNRMDIIKTKDESYYLIYSEKDHSLILFDLVLNKLCDKVEKAHKDNITIVKHFSDNSKRYSLIITTGFDYTIKIWSLTNNKKLINIQTIHNASIDHGLLACLIFGETKNYVASCNLYKTFCLWDVSERKLIKKYLTNKYLLNISSWYDSKSDSNFVILCNDSFITSYKLIEDELVEYRKYSDGSNYNHYSSIVSEKGLLFETDRKGYLSVWDFHLANLIKKIYSGLELNGLCLWNNSYVFAGGLAGTFVLFNLDEETTTKFQVDETFLRSLVKFIHPIYGAAIVTYSNLGVIQIFTSST